MQKWIGSRLSRYEEVECRHYLWSPQLITRASLCKLTPYAWTGCPRPEPAIPCGQAACCAPWPSHERHHSWSLKWFEKLISSSSLKYGTYEGQSSQMVGLTWPSKQQEKSYRPCNFDSKFLPLGFGSQTLNDLLWPTKVFKAMMTFLVRAPRMQNPQTISNGLLQKRSDDTHFQLPRNSRRCFQQSMTEKWDLSAR